MNNEELMQMMTSMDLHEGGMENWLLDNAWLRVANAVEAKERKAIEKAYNLLAMHHSELLNMNAELQRRLNERRILPQIWYKIKRIFKRRGYD